MIAGWIRDALAKGRDYSSQHYQMFLSALQKVDNKEQDDDRSS